MENLTSKAYFEAANETYERFSKIFYRLCAITIYAVNIPMVIVTLYALLTNGLEDGDYNFFWKDW